MFEQPRWPREAFIPVAAGLLWLWHAASFGLVGFLFSMLPGVLLLGGGVSLLLYPGDDRITQYLAVGGILGIPFAIPVLWASGPGLAVALIALSLASFVAAGWAAVRQEPHVAEVPTPDLGVSLAWKVAIDEALLANLTLTHRMPTQAERTRVVDEVVEAHSLFEAKGWIEKPRDYHQTPPPVDGFEISPARAAGIDYEHLRFASEFEPHAEEPGRGRWLSYVPNRTVHAWVVRGGEPEDPWLVCVHGYQMGWPAFDLLAFARTLHPRERRLNLVMPNLPLHGLRRLGRRSGEGFMSGDFLDTVHAEAQAAWDLRRVVSWARGQGAERVGAFGLSLGGYNASLLASLEPDLACVIAGIPVADLSRITWRHGHPLDMVFAEWSGLSRTCVDDLLQVVSPLGLEPLVPWERRAIFAGTADRIVPPEHARDLWRHWDRPRMVWYQGGHLTLQAEPAVPRLVHDVIGQAGLAAPRESLGRAG